jgi:hypothetical protein
LCWKFAAVATELIKTIQQITSNFSSSTAGISPDQSATTSRTVDGEQNTPNTLNQSAAVGIRQENLAPPGAGDSPSASPPLPSIEELSALSLAKRLGSVEDRSDAVLELQRFLDQKGDEGFAEFFEAYTGYVHLAT